MTDDTERYTETVSNSPGGAGGLSRWGAKLPLLLAAAFAAASLFDGTLYLYDWLSGAGVGLTVGWSIFLHDRVGDQ